MTHSHIDMQRTDSLLRGGKAFRDEFDSRLVHQGPGDAWLNKSVSDKVAGGGVLEFMFYFLNSLFLNAKIGVKKLV